MFAVLMVALAADPEFVVVNKCPPVFTVVNKMPAAPAVAAKPIFRGPVFNASHNCPTCGRSQFVISSGGKGGTHTHTCRYDGTVWFH
jgi:hypothetical protein